MLKKPHSLTELVKNTQLKMLKTLNKRVIIIWMNNIKPKMIPVRKEMLENTLWRKMKKIYSSQKDKCHQN